MATDVSAAAERLKPAQVQVVEAERRRADAGGPRRPGPAQADPEGLR